MTKFDPIIEVQKDGLQIPEVRQWSIEKYRLLGAYMDIFTTSMKSKWENLVYIDLFSSSGYAQIKESGKILKSSALIALSIPNSFTHCIFCEKDPKLIDSLRKRVERDFPDKNVKFIQGDINDNIAEVDKMIPEFSKQNRVLSFGFIDPFSLNLSKHPI